jgi:hypothetical protein
MDETCGLKRVALAFMAHVPAGYPAQLVVDKRHELLERRFVALTPIQQEPGYLVSRGF